MSERKTTGVDWSCMAGKGQANTQEHRVLINKSNGKRQIGKSRQR